MYQYNVRMLYIHLFGHLRLFEQERPYSAHVPRRAQPLWAYLLLHRDKPVQRDHLAYLLDPDSSDRAARAHLRSDLHGLQQALPPSPQHQPWLLHDSSTIQWNPAADYWLDVAEFERLSESADHLPKSVALYSGDLLVNIYADWLAIERQHLRNQYLDNLRKLSATSIAQHDHQQAVVYLQQILAHEPLSEDVIGELLRLWYWNGNRTGAIDTYQRFERLLKKELGIAPASETQALYKAICQNAPIDAYTSRFRQSLQTQRPTNLPGALNSFFGRNQELLQLQQLLASFAPSQRLVTLIGLAGCGKTRLALEIAGRLQAAPKTPFPDGIFFVDLAAIHHPEGVLAAIAQTLNIPRKEDAALSEFLRHRHLLLVMDNFEQVLAAGPLVAELLAACPNVRALVTSRTALHIYGEYEFALAPLPLPETGSSVSWQQIHDNPAVALFLARAEEHCAPIELNEENAPILAEICTRLEGLPLAVELAANRARLFSPAAILAHLKDRLAFLASRERNLPERHKSLRSAIDWSYDLLSEAEKTLFAAVGVFADHWTPQAAQAVCDCLDEKEMLTSLDDLAAQSLIYIHSRGQPPRFGMISTLREFALERLQEQGLLEAARRRHAQHYAQLVELHLQYTSQEDWIQYAQAEAANLQAALSWSLEMPEDLPRVEIGVRLSTGLMAFWSITNQMKTGWGWYEQQISCSQLLPINLQAALFTAAGNFAQYLGDFSRSESLLYKAIQLAQEAAETTWESAALRYLGTGARRQGDYQRAHELLTKSIAIEHAAYGKRMNSGIAAAYNNLAIVLTNLGEYSQASAFLQDNLNYHKAQNDERRVSITLYNLAGLALEQKKEDEAETFLRQSLEIRAKLGDQYGIALCLAGMVDLAIQRKQAVRGARLSGSHQMLYPHEGRMLITKKTIDLQRQLETLRVELGEQHFSAAWAEGQAMTIEQAVAYALETLTQTDPPTEQASEKPDFPPDPLDDEMATQWLEAYWHPQGLKCPTCGSSQARFFRATGKSGLAVYRCQQCQASYSLYSNTPLQGSHLRPSQAVVLLRQINQGESSSHLAHRLGISRQTVNKLRKTLKTAR